MIGPNPPSGFGRFRARWDLRVRWTAGELILLKNLRNGPNGKKMDTLYPQNADLPKIVDTGLMGLKWVSTRFDKIRQKRVSTNWPYMAKNGYNVSTKRRKCQFRGFFPDFISI